MDCDVTLENLAIHPYLQLVMVIDAIGEIHCDVGS
jgi:hypothetical protein